MVDSEIVVRNFEVTKNAPKPTQVQSQYNQSHAIRHAHEVEGVEKLDLGLMTPSDSNATPQHLGRQSSIYNPPPVAVSRPYDEPEIGLDDDSDEI